MSERSTGPTESRQLDEPSAGPSPAAGDSHPNEAGSSEPIEVGNSQAMTADGSQSVDIGGSPAVEIGRSQAVEIGGSRPIEMDGSRPIEMDGEPFALTEPADDEPASAAPPIRRSRAKVIVLSALLVAGLAGAAVIGTGMWRIASQKDATLVAPPQVATLRADQSDTGRETAEYLTTALAAEVDLDDTVGAVYTDSSATDRGVLFFGGTTLIWTPASDLDTAFTLLADEQGAVTGLHQVEAGPLGGTMKCGMTRSDDGDISVCGWADHGSLALAMFPNRSEADAARLLLDIRSAAQTRQ